MKKLSILFLFAAASIITSCSKDDDNNNGSNTAPNSNINKLFNKEWKIASIISNGVDIANCLPECELDNSMQFYSNFSLVKREGALKCNPVSPDSTTEAWSWLNNNTQLVFDGNTATVLSIGDSTMILTYQNNNGSNDIYTYKIGSGALVTNSTKLCGKDWKIVSIFSGGVDLTAFQPGCQLDNLTRFFTNGTVNNDEGDTKCDPTDPQSTPGTWSWTANETKLIIDGDTATVITNSCNVLKLSADDGQGGTYEITFEL